MITALNSLIGRLCSGLRLLYWYPALLLLPLLLGAPTPDQTASSAKTTHIWLYSTGAPKRLCAGEDYTVHVYVSSSTTVDSGPKGTDWPGIDVSAAVDDTSIATITPPKQTTGSGSAPTQGRTSPGTNANTDDDELPALPVSPYAVFKLHAVKAGRTAFTFKAEVPRRITRGLDSILGKTTFVEVVNCNYYVSLIFFLHAPHKGLWAEASGNVPRTKLRLDPDTNHLDGKAEITVQGSSGANFTPP